MEKELDLWHTQILSHSLPHPQKSRTYILNRMENLWLKPNATFGEILKNFNRIETHLAHIPDVYVLGDMMMYYEEGNPRKSISPDIFVAFGIGRKERRIYKIWEEGKPPDFVLEFASKGTYRNDMRRKVELYAAIGISEYFVYDVDRRYLPRPLMGFSSRWRCLC